VQAGTESIRLEREIQRLVAFIPVPIEVGWPVFV
jgi:hypothetical protein